MKSIDSGRRRSVPSTISGRSRHDELVEVTLDSTSVVFVVKPDCWGCRDVLDASLDPLAQCAVYFVAAGRDDEWSQLRHEVIVSPEWLMAADVRFPPVYLYIRNGVVEQEGAFLDIAHVAAELP